MTQILGPVQDQPYFSTVIVPDLQSLHLSEDEKAAVDRLQMKAWRQREWMLLTDAYYRGMQVITNLGIAVPPELSFLRAILGWPKIAVDPFVERLGLDSFRLSNSITADETLSDVWLINGMDAEQSLAFLEALVMSHSWFTLGSGDDPANDSPEICVESPLNITANWDLKGKLPKEALQAYWKDNRRHAALFLPTQTVHIAEDDRGQWVIVYRDEHNFGMLPLVRMANRPRASWRDGSSEITPELMSITDAACRTLLNLTVAGEFYSVPQKLILGATEADFVDQDGQQKSAWATYISHILALKRDAEGELPEIKQFDAYDPSVFTKVLDMYAGQAAGIMGANPQDLGLYTQGNPISAEAYNVVEARRDRRTRRMHATFGPSLVGVGQMAMRFLNNGDLPKGYEKLAADWTDPELPNFTGMADGMSKLMSEGSVPRQSDVALRKLGFNAVERRQMAAERKLPGNQAETVIDAIGSSVEGKAIRAANALATAAKPDAPAPVPPPAP